MNKKKIHFNLRKFIVVILFVFCQLLALTSWAEKNFFLEKTSNDKITSQLTKDWLDGQSYNQVRGIKPFFGYSGEFLSVLDGGNETGTSWHGLVDLGVDFYLEQLLGIRNGLVRVHGQSIQGGDPSEFVGNINTLSNMVGFNTTRLFQIWYEQEFLDGSISFKFGLISLEDGFMTDKSSELFINGGFGELSTQSLNNAAPTWPIGALGALLYLEPSKNLYFQVGVYDGNVGGEEINNDGMHVKLGGMEGFLYLFELGITSNILGRDGIYKIGGFCHSGEEFINFNTGEIVNGNTCVYFSINQEITDTFNSWWRLGYSPDKEKNIVSFDTDFGINWMGPLEQRPEDNFGLAFLYTRFSSDYVGANPGVSTMESVIELTYRVVIAPWILVQPTFQMIFNPHEGENNASVFGVRSQIIF